MLAKSVSQLGLEHDIPTVLINAPFNGDAFNAILQGIQRPVILIFDEFEKVYDRDQQEAILTMLDGTASSHKMVIFTVNDEFRLVDHILNRPGRVYYRYRYGAVDERTIREYCTDHLKNQAPDVLDAIIRTGTIVSRFSMDMLIAMVQELNRYGETVAEVLEHLNITPDGSTQQFTHAVMVNGAALPNTTVRMHGHNEHHPLTPEGRRYITYRVGDAPDDEYRDDIVLPDDPEAKYEQRDGGMWRELFFGVENFIGVTPTGSLRFGLSKEGHEIQLTAVPIVSGYGHIWRAA
jgi:sulfur carrier protein ThiS